MKTFWCDYARDVVDAYTCSQCIYFKNCAQALYAGVHDAYKSESQPKQTTRAFKKHTEHVHKTK